MASVLETSLNMPAWFDTVVVSFLILGFPIALILAWAFESTPEGIKRTEAVDPAQSTTKETARKLDYVLIIGLAIVGVLIIGDRLMPSSPKEQNELAASATVDDLKGQSIAVLPFEDFSPSNDQTYFANGISEELLNVLARVEGLQVASRTSAFSFQGRDISVAEIGKALGVAHVLEGSIRKAGNTLRITAQLIDTKTDVHLWSQTYDRPLTAENIFEIQDDISKAIVLELNGHLDLIPDASERLTQSTEALEAYLKAKEAYGPRTVEGIEEGITELIRAVTIDPNFAVAHAKLSRAYRLAMAYGDLARKYSIPRSQIHIDQALALAPNDWDVLSEYAWHLEDARQVQAAAVDQVLAGFDAAIAANPNNAEAYRGKGYMLTRVNRREEAKAALEKARALNPKDPLIFLNLAGIARTQGDAKTAIALSIQAVKVDPETLYSRSVLANNYTSFGDLVTAHRVSKSCVVQRECVQSLRQIYSRLNIEVDGFGPATDDYSLYIKHYLAGDFDKVAQVTSNAATAPLTAKVRIYASIGRWSEAYQLIQDNGAVFEPFFQDDVNRDQDTIATEIALLATLEQQKDVRADVIRQSLSKQYQGVVSSGYNEPTAFLNGAAWHALNGDSDAAMQWLNSLADRGFPTPLFFDSIFEPLEQRTDYQAFLARTQGYVARDRALIQAQLDEPPAIWWSPDEFSEGDH
jgi:TolB-like protein/Flp pilus assembly protein TadD